MLFTTTQQQEEIRKTVREFAETEIKPIAFMLDKENEFPSEAIAKFGKMGLMGIPYPKEYGGAGLDVISYAIAVEELSCRRWYRCYSVRTCLTGKLPYFCVWYRGTEAEISGTAGKR